jgi:energy-coupling factor transporter ATP-binding protein EcfA2
MTYIPKITSLPSRYEPLVQQFGDKAKMTFVPSELDMNIIKRFIAHSESAGQGKLLFISAESGTGKSTFIHSLEVFLPDKISAVLRLPPSYELPLAEIPKFLANLPKLTKVTIVNFDGRESPTFDEAEYRTFLISINSLLRTRRDLLIIWPVTDNAFANQIVDLLKLVGGKSIFGNDEIIDLHGLSKNQYQLVLEKILQVANWKLVDAAISTTEVDNLISGSNTVGSFLDELQALIAERFDIGQVGVTYPNLVIVMSSGSPEVRETCRSLRRADSFYLESSRLLMYTKKSNVAEWWRNRATDLRAALPHVIALFNAQLVSLSASSVVHSVLQHGDNSITQHVQGVRSNRGNAINVVKSSELYKFISGAAIDNREYGSNVKDETFDSYTRLQAVSKTSHRDINTAIIRMVQDAGGNIPNPEFEKNLGHGLLIDVAYQGVDNLMALEFHHKHKDESTQNKMAIYILEKIKEYSINYGLANR